MSLTKQDLKDMETKLDEFGELGHEIEQMLIDEIRRLQGIIKKVATPIEPGSVDGGKWVSWESMVWNRCKKERERFDGSSTDS